jgi:hypothetical protein
VIPTTATVEVAATQTHTLWRDDGTPAARTTASISHTAAAWVACPDGKA